MVVDDLFSKVVRYHIVTRHRMHFPSVSGAQEGGDEDVGVPGVGVVGSRGQGQSP